MLQLLLKTSIAVLVCAIGMTARIDDITFLWHRPALLLKSVAAMYVVMPVAAVIMAGLLDLPQGTELALVILAICAGAPLLPKKLIKFGGDPPYVFSLIVITSLLAVLTVPASLQILAQVIAFDTTAVRPVQVAIVIFKTFLLPLGLGMLVRILAPSIMEKIGALLLKIAGIVLGLCAIVALAGGFHLIFEVGWQSLLAFALFAIIAILAGHLLGGPDPSTRTSLSIACLSRHVGLALLIAAGVRGQNALALVIAYLVASIAISVCYILLITRSRKIK